jgi:hypothetical protein
MKHLNPLVIAAAALAIFASAGQVNARADDNIAASPKVRSQHNEHYNRTHPAPPQVTVPVVTATANSQLAASPKIHSQKQGRSVQVAPVVMSTTQTAGYRPTGSDGITASPKARFMLGERQQTFEIAPLK